MARTANHEPSAVAAQPGHTPRAALARLLFGAWIAKAIAVATELGVADLLAGGPRPVADLAAATGTDTPSLARLLRCLVDAGVFREDEPGRFGLTPVGACLRSDAPERGRPAALLHSRLYQSAFDELPYSLRTGAPGFDRAFGAPLFAYLAANPADGALFDENMAGLHAARAAAALDVYDFSRFRRVVDVGGGQGMFLTTLLAAVPTLHGILFDLPEVVARVRLADLSSRFPRRLELAGGNFFQAVPSGDGYLVSNIIHDWDDERSIAILTTCRRAAAPNARLLIVEELLTAGVSSPRTRVIDLIMLALTGGQERTAAEYGALLTAAGWRMTRVVPTSEGASIVEGIAE